MPDLVVKSLSFIGALGFLLYGMRLMSDGVQKSAGERLQRVLGMITGNRFVGLLTGLVITMIIQSSGATTVMVVSFINAGLISLVQSVGVIFGANIGTTVTAWIVSIFGFNFKISSFAIPLFGMGFFITLLKKDKIKNLGEAIMGFGLLFIGLDWLKDVFMIDASSLGWFKDIQNWGVGSIAIGFVIGIVITALLHSSSAFTAIVITMAVPVLQQDGSMQSLINWDVACAMTLGSNIGSTIDAVLAAFGTSADARRSALVHVLFNVIGTILALIFFNPFLYLIDLISGSANEAIKMSIFHTVFKSINTIILLPFVNQIAALTRKIIKDKPEANESKYKIPLVVSKSHNTIELYIVQAEKEIEKMGSRVMNMLCEVCAALEKCDKSEISEISDKIYQEEDYLDQMNEEITSYLINVASMDSATGLIQNRINQLLQIAGNLENVSDEVTSIIYNIDKYVGKKAEKGEEKLGYDKLLPYMEKLLEFFTFATKHISSGVSDSERSVAYSMEDEIDSIEKILKKDSRKRLEDGKNVKAELKYMDIVRRIENAGDAIFTIVRVL